MINHCNDLDLFQELYIYIHTHAPWRVVVKDLVMLKGVHVKTSIRMNV